MGAPGLTICTCKCTFLSMSKRYSIAEARANLPTIVREAESGKEIQLTRRGRPVAMVVSSQQYERLRPRFVEAYRSFVKKFPPNEVGLDNGFFELIRQESAGREVPL